jgi:hypothetical protein
MRKKIQRESVEQLEKRSKGIKNVFLVRITSGNAEKPAHAHQTHANAHRKRGAVRNTFKYAYTTCFSQKNDQICAYAQEKPSICSVLVSKTSGKAEKLANTHQL